jgi:hypothetical protein
MERAERSRPWTESVPIGEPVSLEEAEAEAEGVDRGQGRGSEAHGSPLGRLPEAGQRYHRPIRGRRSTSRDWPRIPSEAIGWAGRRRTPGRGTAAGRGSAARSG